MKFNYIIICKLLCLFSLLIVIRGINIPQFIYSTVDGYFSLQFGAFRSNAGMDIFAYISCSCAGIYVKYISRSGIAKSQDMISSALVVMPNDFPKLYQFILLPAV